MHRGLEAIAIALIFAAMMTAAARFFLAIQPQLEYALISAHRASAYFLLLSSSPEDFLNKTLSLPEAREGYGEFSVVVLVPDSEAGDLVPVVVSFEP